MLRVEDNETAMEALYIICMHAHSLPVKMSNSLGSIQFLTLTTYGKVNHSATSTTKI